MNSINDNTCVLNPCDGFKTEVMSTYDIRLSLQDFIYDHFKGCISFGDYFEFGDPSNVLIDKYALAYLIRIIIKELVFMRVTCEISYAVSERGFHLKFRYPKDKVLSTKALSMIMGAATEYNIELDTDDGLIVITMPPYPLRTVKVYQSRMLRFRVALDDAFDEDFEHIYTPKTVKAHGNSYESQ